MELTIHIGPHKTGTTALQTAFAKAAASLRRNGVLYPKTNWLFPAQHRLAFAMKNRRIAPSDRPDVTAETDQLSRALDRFSGSQALISSEEFFSCPPEAIEALRQRLGPARIVTFLRRPDDFLVSCYNQKIKQPGNGFSVPIHKFLKSPHLIAPEFDMAGCVSNWADAFGDAAIHLETYEAGDPLTRLNAILGLTDGPPPPSGRPNASVPGAVAEVMRHAKTIGMDETRQRRLFDLAVEHFRTRPPFYVSTNDRRRVVASVEPRLDALFSRFGKSNPYRADTLPDEEEPERYNLVHQDLMSLIQTLL